MPTTLTFEHSITDQVKIIALDVTGVVTSLYCSETGMQYQVRYTYNGEAKSCYFYPFEIKKIN